MKMETWLMDSKIQYFKDISSPDVNQIQIPREIFCDRWQADTKTYGEIQRAKNGQNIAETEHGERTCPISA